MIMPVHVPAVVRIPQMIMFAIAVELVYAKLAWQDNKTFRKNLNNKFDI